MHPHVGTPRPTVAQSLRRMFLSSRNAESISPSPEFHLIEHLDTGSAGPYFAETRTPVLELLNWAMLHCRLTGKWHGHAAPPTPAPPTPMHMLRLKGGSPGKQLMSN